MAFTVWFSQELERRALYNTSGVCSDLSSMASETSPGRSPSLPSSAAAELPADVHPNVFLGDVLSWISLQCTRQGVGSRAMSAAIKHFLKKISSPKREVILLVTHWGFCRLRFLIALLCLLFILQLKSRVALMLLCISKYWFFFSCLHLMFSPLFSFFPLFFSDQPSHHRCEERIGAEIAFS